MSQQMTLAAEPRQQTGKGAARTLRREGKVPAVIYGHGREPEALTIEAVALQRALSGHSGSTVLDVTVADRAPVKALIREIQRDTLRPAVIVHLDLYEIHADEKITLEVPVHLNGIADGVRNFGGVMDHSLRELEIRVFPRDIPDHIEVDVTDLPIGHSIFVRDLTFAAGEILTDEDVVVCTVVAPRVEEEAPVEETEEVAEPELIRKPKAEDDEDDEAEDE